MQPKTHCIWRTVAFPVMTLVASIGCSGSTKNEPGGSTSTGGTPSNSGGAGGLGFGVGSGGTPASTGGTPSVGGNPSGNPEAGGTSPSSGGAPHGGQSGAPTGAAGAGSSGSGNPSAAAPSAGCGKATTLVNGRTTIDVGGTMREYILALPDKYDQNHPYRLIFGWHPWGGSAQQVASGGYYGLVSQAKGSAIFVAAEGLDFGGNGKGWGNQNGQDIALLKAMLDLFRSQLCIDENRIFSTGFSFGGMMSYTVGYEFDVFRAIAPCSGDLQVIPHKETNTKPLPIMAFHGDKDDFVTTARGRAARDKYLARNQCGTMTMPVSPSPCVEYQGCAVPTFWCEFSGGHNTWSEEPKAIWKFFSQF